MSHFTCMVKILNEEVAAVGFDTALEAKMRPFKEEAEQEFLVFENVEEASRKRWETESTKMVRMPDGRLLFPWDDEFKVRGSSPLNNKTILPPGLKEEEIPYKEKYLTFESFVEDFEGYKKDEEQNAYGHWHNPNAKWDWYVLGGRWSGELHLKVLGKGFQGSHGLTSRAIIRDDFKTDAAQFKNINWESMSSSVDFEIEKFYKEVECLRVFEAKDKGTLTKEEQKAKWDLGLNIRDQLLDLGLMNKNEEGHYTTTKTDFTLEDLKKNHRSEWEFRTFAVLDESSYWHEKGSMGWFGCHSGSEEACAAWVKNFRKNFIENTLPDTWIAIVDCHI